MLEVVDWASFGYGAGTLAVSTYAWSARGPITRGIQRYRRWRQKRRLVWALGKNQVAMLQARVDELEQKSHELQKQAMKATAARNNILRRDLAWENYQRRKKGLPVLGGLPVGPGAISPVVEEPEWVGVPCTCSHGSRQHAIVEPEACRVSACYCRSFEAA